MRYRLIDAFLMHNARRQNARDMLPNDVVVAQPGAVAGVDPGR